jgi:hypothetical protein
MKLKSKFIKILQTGNDERWLSLQYATFATLIWCLFSETLGKIGLGFYAANISSLPLSAMKYMVMKYSVYCDGLAKSTKLWSHKTPLLGKQRSFGCFVLNITVGVYL